VRAWGEDTHSELEFLGYNKEEGEALPFLGDIFNRQVGITVDMRRPKWSQTETGPLIGSPPLSCLTFVSLDL
jgi:hypothetical protein